MFSYSQDEIDSYIFPVELAFLPIKSQTTDEYKHMYTGSHSID